MQLRFDLNNGLLASVLCPENSICNGCVHHTGLLKVSRAQELSWVCILIVHLAESPLPEFWQGAHLRMIR